MIKDTETNSSNSVIRLSKTEREFYYDYTVLRLADFIVSCSTAEKTSSSQCKETGYSETEHDATNCGLRSRIAQIFSAGAEGASSVGDANFWD